jgi:hypothetical protein
VARGLIGPVIRSRTGRQATLRVGADGDQLGKTARGEDLLGSVNERACCGWHGPAFRACPERRASSSRLPAEQLYQL